MVYHSPTLPMLFGRMPRSGGFVGVDNVTFNVARGEIFGLVGQNGAGKTTLIKSICSLLRPTSGHIRIEGFDTVTDEMNVRKTVGLITSNERSFYWRLTGQQNLEFFSAIHKLEKREALAWISELIEFLGLQPYRYERFDALSTGTKQRFAIARGMLAKPRVLLLDEPTKGVDPLNATEIISLLRDKLPKIWAPTMIITSHNLREVELLCSRVGIMHRSKLVAQGTMDELVQAAKLTSHHRIVYACRKNLSIDAILPPSLVASAELDRVEDGLFDLTFHASEGSDLVGSALRQLLKHDVNIKSVDRQKQTLDDVFAHFVNRQPN